MAFLWKLQIFLVFFAIYNQVMYFVCLFPSLISSCVVHIVIPDVKCAVYELLDYMKEQIISKFSCETQDLDIRHHYLFMFFFFFIYFGLIFVISAKRDVSPYLSNKVIVFCIIVKFTLSLFMKLNIVIHTSCVHEFIDIYCSMDVPD